jgi:hypothetical protein
MIEVPLVKRPLRPVVGVPPVEAPVLDDRLLRRGAYCDGTTGVHGIRQRMLFAQVFFFIDFLDSDTATSGNQDGSTSACGSCV